MGLLDDIALFARSQAEMDAARVDAERKLAEQYGSLAAYTGAQFAPGSATLEARGGMAQPPELGLPVSDLPEYMVEGEKLPSMAETYDVFQSADPYMEQPSAGYVPKRPMPNPEAQQSALDLLLLGMGVTGDALQAFGPAGALAGGVLKTPKALANLRGAVRSFDSANSWRLDPLGFKSKLIEELRIATNEGMTFQNFQALENYLKKKGVKPEEINTMFQIRNMSEQDQFIRFSPGQKFNKRIDPGKVLKEATSTGARSSNRRTLLNEVAYNNIDAQTQNEPAGFVTPVVGRNRYTNAGVFTMHPREIDLKYLADDSNPLNHQSYVLTFDSPVDAKVENSVRGVESPYRYQNTHYSSKTPFGGREPRTDVLGHYRTTDRVYMDPDTDQPKRILFLEEVQSDQIGHLNSLRQDRSFFEEISEKLKGLSEDIGTGDLIDAESQQREIPSSLLTKVYGDKYMALGEVVNELEESATLGELSLKGRVFFEELKSEFNKMHDKLFDGNITLSELDDADLDIYELSLAAKSMASDLTNSLSKADKLAPFASDSKKMYDALVKRIKMRAYRQGYDGIALAPGEVQVDRWASILHTDKQKEGMRKIYSDLIQPRINKAMGHKADGTMRMENPDIDRDDPDAGGYGRIYNAPVWLFTEDDLKKIETEGMYEYKDGGAVNKIVNDVDIFS
jgi:hypothetical protein